MLTKEQKIDLIKDQSEKHEITAYEYGQKSGVSEMSAYNILSGKNTSPRNKTLNLMLEYIESRIVGSAIPGHKNYRENINNIDELEKPSTDQISLEDRITQKVFARMDKMDDKLDILIEMMGRISTLEERTKMLALLNKAEEIEKENEER